MMLLSLLLLLLVAAPGSHAAPRRAGARHAGGGAGATTTPPPPSNLAMPTFKKPPLLRRPPMGWMSWNHFRCGVNASSPDAISAALVSDTAAGLVDGGFLAAGYTILAIDDCWQARERGPAGVVVADPVRFPGGIAAVGRVIHGSGLLFGLYGDVGPRTCAGFPGNGGHFAADAAAMASAGVDYFKADGCNAATANLAALYSDLAAALASSGRAIALSCSWPAYLPDARAMRRAARGGHPLPPIPYAQLASVCHAWRNWNDIDSDPGSIASIASYWAYAARRSPGFTTPALPGPGAWHDPDELLVGEPAIPFAWQAAQFALWCVWGAPLFLSADVRGHGGGGGGGGAFSPEARALALDPELIAINQRGAGGPVLVGCGGGRGGGEDSLRGCGRAQAWARPLEGGAVAVVAARLDQVAPQTTAQPVCVRVDDVLAAAGRTWPEAEVEAPPHPHRRVSLCWRSVPLTPRSTPRRAYTAWTILASFSHRSEAGEDLCLDVGGGGGRAAVAVGRPCRDEEADS